MCNYEKIQGLDRAFLRLENRVICRVTRMCIQLKRHVTCFDKYGWSVLLAYVTPYYKYSYEALYIQSVHAVQVGPREGYPRECPVLWLA